MAESPQTVRKGSCYCGDVSYEVKGNPLFSLYCHCTQCQRSFGAVFVNAVHFTPAAFSWTFSAEKKSEAEAQEGCTVYRCKNCRGAPATQMSDTQNWALRGTQLERDEGGKIKKWEGVSPSAHIWYSKRVVDVADALPKWAGFPNASERLG